jgi:hypothetical protein
MIGVCLRRIHEKLEIFRLLTRDVETKPAELLLDLIDLDMMESAEVEEGGVKPVPTLTTGNMNVAH